MSINDTDLLEKVKNVARELDGLAFVMVVIDPKSSEAQQFSNMPPGVSKRILLDSADKLGEVPPQIHSLKGH